MKNHGYVFVYGTLKKGGFFSKRFNKVRRKSTKAKITGTMYCMGGFPGIVMKGGKTIYGELHLYDKFGKVIKEMDKIEGHYGRGNKNNLYNKNIIQVKTSSGVKRAIVYTLNTARINIKGHIIQENGIWPID